MKYASLEQELAVVELIERGYDLFDEDKQPPHPAYGIYLMTYPSKGIFTYRKVCDDGSIKDLRLSQVSDHFARLARGDYR